VKVILREQKSGVAEVVGTILILGMTVALFSTVILWVSSVPAPTAQTRIDVSSVMQPIYSAAGLVIGVNITLTHLGGEALHPVPTIVYVTDQPGSNPPTTDVATLHLFNGRLANPSGLLDGSDSVWSTGERWAYENFAFSPSDSITVTIVDTTKSLVVWSGQMSPAAGVRPPVFVSVWADGTPSTLVPDPVQAGLGFSLDAQVIDPDGDLNPSSVYATMTAWYGSGTVCQMPLPMRDDGVFPDHMPGDGIFALGGNVCMNAPYPAVSWSGSFILINATDLRGHQTRTRFVLNVFSQGAGSGGGTTIPSQLWQYIGYVQIRTGEVWVSNLSNPYTTANTYQPYRVPKTWLQNGALFHFRMANHGNTTIFVDGWTEAFFQNTQSSAGIALFVVAPCNPTPAAGAGGVVAYPGNPTNINDFEYAHPGVPASCSSTIAPAVFDINPFDQQTGGTPYVTLVYNKVAFGAGSTYNWPASATYFISILVSGMAGPTNYTYAQLVSGGPNPSGCAGLGPNYNPHNHLLDPNPACRTQWYAQVIPFIGMVVY